MTATMIDETEPVSLLDELRRQEASAARESSADWRELIVSVTDGITTDAGEIHAELLRLGRSVDELSAAVELLKQRRQWANQVAAGVLADSECPRIADAIAAADADFVAAEQRHLEITGPLFNQRNDAVAALSLAFSAKGALIRTCNDPESMAAIARIDQRMAEIRQQIQVLKSKRDTKTGALIDWRNSGDDAYRRDIERVTGEVAEMSSALDSLNSEAERLNTERIEVETKMLCDPERF